MANEGQSEGSYRGCFAALRFNGWRKCFIFGLLLFLTLLVLINIGLTLWIFTALRIHKDGMGPVRVYAGGIQLTGTAFLDDLIASTIKSQPGRPLSIDSYNNFTIRTLEKNGRIRTSLFIDEDKFEAKSEKFIIRDRDGNLLFSSDSGQVTVGTENFRILSEGGVTFENSILTPMLRSTVGQDLVLESLTRSLKLESPHKILINSEKIDTDIRGDLRLKSKKLILDAPRIELKNLKKAQPWHSEEMVPKVKQAIYQLCACENGKLFLAKSLGTCSVYDESIC